MPFTIGPPSKINQDFRQITEQEYASIELARDRIYWLFSFHENYDIVLENYRELETSLFSVTLNFVVDRLFVDRRELDSHRRLLCRKLSNLLESITSLHCRLDRRTVEVFGRKSPERKLIEDLRKKYCQSSASYALMMELRRYSQHADLPVHALIQPNKWENRGDVQRARLVRTTVPGLNLSELFHDRMSDKAMLTALREKFGPVVPLFPEVRAAMSALSSFLKAIEQEFKEKQESWLKEIEDVTQQFTSSKPGNVCVAKWDNEGTLVEDVQLTVNWRLRLLFLQQRHPHLANLERMEISNLMPADY
jgi:hypothetical protein